MAGTSWIHTYYQGIKNGTYTVGRWIEQVYEYIIHGLENKEFFLDLKRANDAIEYFETHCFHTEGPLAPGNITLEVWEKAFYSAVYGLVDANGLRQFREIVLVVGRKNGKTKIASSAGKYTFEREGGYGARVFCIAPKLDQADLVYNDIWQMVTLDPDYQELKLRLEEKDEHNKRLYDDAGLPRHRKCGMLPLLKRNRRTWRIPFAANLLPSGGNRNMTSRWANMFRPSRSSSSPDPACGS